MKIKNNSAYIDGANLDKGLKTLGWKLDYKKFRVWLTEKFNVKDAYIFLGNIPKYNKLYQYLSESGFVLVFKEVVYNDGKAKGNCDADLVLKMTQDFFYKKYDNLLLVASDGDYASIIYFIKSENKSIGIISPAKKEKCSILLKRTDAKIFYINDQKGILKFKDKNEK